MKNVKNKKLHDWMLKNRFDCTTLAESLIRHGAKVTKAAVWEWLRNGRIPYDDTMLSLDLLIEEVQKEKLDAKELFAK